MLAIDGLIAHWSGDGNAADSLGGNNGNLEAGATFAPGLVGQAFSLDGIDDRIRVPNSAALNPTAGFTIEGWIRSDSTDGPRVIASKWNDNTSDWSYIFKDHNNNDKLRIELRSGSINSFADLAGNTSIVTGLWTHVAMTYDTSSVRLYYNGALDGTQQVDPSALIHASTTDFLIGAVFTGGGISENFRGLIDEVSLYDRALGAVEIQSIYDSTALLATATADSYTTAGGSKLRVNAPGVLANDTGALFAMLVSEPSHGTLTLRPSGSFVYTPSSGFVGQDSFSYRANASASSNTTTVTIDVTVPPDPMYGIDWQVTTDLGLMRSGDIARGVAYQSDGKFVVLAEAPGSSAVIGRYNDDGSLDTTFGTAGHVNAVAFAKTFRGQSIAVDSVGRIVVAGSYHDLDGIDFGVIRLNSDGSLDTAFNDDGTQAIDFGNTNDYATSVAVDSADRIVVAGCSEDSGFRVARLNSDGSLDTTFSDDGKQTISFFGGFEEKANSVVVDGADRIVIAGNAYLGGNYDFAVARLNSDGSLDTTFSDDGKQTIHFTSSAYDWANSVALDSAGRIVLAGQASPDSGGNFGPTFAIVRLKTDGTLDETFSNDGKTTVTFWGSEEEVANSVALDSAGRVVVTGWFPNSFLVIRLNADGAVDTTFGDSGQKIIDFGDVGVSAYAGAVDSADRILVVGGSSLGGPAFFNRLSLARVNAFGVLDTTFNGDGRLLTNLSLLPAWDVATDVAYQSDGKIIVLGLADYGSGTGSGAIARYNPDGSLDTTFGTEGKLILGAEPYFAVAVDSLDRIILAADQSLVRLNPDGSSDMTFGDDGRQSFNWWFISSSYGGTGLAVDSTNRILMSGGTGVGYFGVVRWNADGSVDTSFGVDGRQVVELWGIADRVAVDSAGRILISGASSGSQFAIARLNTDGSLDTTFGTGGKQTLDFFNVSDSDQYEGPQRRFTRLTVDSTDRVIVAGATHQEATGYDFAVARLTSDGQLDGSFAVGGWQAIDFGGQFDFANGVAIDGAGRIVVVGSTYQGEGDHYSSDWENDFAVVRLNEDGSFDTSFGQGMVNFSTYDIAVGVIIDNAGGIVIVGDSWSADSDSYDLALVRLFGDADADGIENSVDTQPALFSSDFSDIAIGGATTGTILSRGDQIVTIVDAENSADGLLISADPAGGAIPAAIQVEGSTIYLDAGESIIVTHGSVEVQVLTGPVEAELRNVNGDLVAVVNLPSGTGGLFDPEAATLTITGTSGNDVFALTSTGATVNGLVITTSAGLALLTLASGGGSDTFTLVGAPPSAFEVAGGDPSDRLTVTSTSTATDLTDGVVTLPEAILYANQHSGPDDIAFNIPLNDPTYLATGRFVIFGGQPAITQQVFINGYSQPGAAANSFGVGQGSNAVIKIELAGSGGTGLEVANGVGTVIRGLAIGGYTFGIVVRGPSTGTVIEGNFIGTDPQGAIARANVIGVALISATELFVASQTSNNRIEGNLISGNSAFGVVAGSQNGAVLPVVGTQIFGNYIGTNATGLQGLHNGVGVALNSSDNSQVGGTLPGQANVIAYNTSAAVSIGASGAPSGPGYVGHGNTVSGNSIFSNVGLGIDLSTNTFSPDGVTQNNGQPIATVNNGYQNFPQLQFAAGGPTTRIIGSLQIAAPDSRPDPAQYTIDVYANAVQERQGKRYLGSFNVLVDASGSVSFDRYISSSTLAGEYLTATATDTAGNTSEFSSATIVASGSGDADGDGIANMIDTQPTTFSDDFSDVANGGATTGTILSRGDQTITIADALNSTDGVILTAAASGGATPATVNIDGGATNLGGAATLTLSPGDQVIATHGSVILDVLAGTVEATYKASTGQVVATASLAAGTELTFKPDTVTFVAADTNEVPVEVVLVGTNDQEAAATVSSGDEITFNPETFDVIAPSTNETPVSIVVSTGEVITANPGTTVHAAVQTVSVNIVPDSLNLDSNGLLTVLIFGAANFSSAQIDVTTVRFAGASAWQWALVDANHDGLLDLQLKFRTQDTALRELYEQLLVDDHDADGVLDSTRQVAQVGVTGQTLDDALFSGSDDLTLFLAGKSLKTLLNQLADAGAI